MVGVTFQKKKKKTHLRSCFIFFPSSSRLLSPPHVSFPTSVTLSAVHPNTLTHISHDTLSHTHTHTHTFPLTTNLLSFSHTSTHTHTHSHTPLVAISATLLTGANQSYNTFIISSPPQAPSPLSEISFRPLWMFHCTGNTQLHHGHGGTGPGRKQPPTIRHQTDQV